MIGTDELAKLDLLIRDARQLVEAGQPAAALRDELAFAVPKLLEEIHQLRQHIEVSCLCDEASRTAGVTCIHCDALTA